MAHRLCDDSSVVNCCRLCWTIHSLLFTNHHNSVRDSRMHQCTPAAAAGLWYSTRPIRYDKSSMFIHYSVPLQV